VTRGDELSLVEARRIAVAAQGLATPRPSGRVDVRHLRRVIARIHLLQIDSVNVLARAHYLPLFSRLGPYPMTALDDLAYRRRELFETWAHVASFLPVSLYPIARLRMRRVAGDPRYGPLTWRFAHDEATYVDQVLAEVAERGPLAASELTDPGTKEGPWWGWAPGKVALEWLFTIGAVAVHSRRNFERRYDLTERVIPADALARPDLTDEEGQRLQLTLAARALGVATLTDLADYFRVKPKLARPAVEELADAGGLRRVRVEGSALTWYLDPDAVHPRRVDGRALLVPFDPLVWERARTERLFGFHYRIEIYLPAAKRTYGYYVLPFLLGDRLVARVDLKADRAARTLLVRGAFAEPGTDPHAVAAPLYVELGELARWLDLGRIDITDHGDLAPALRRAAGGRK